MLRKPCASSARASRRTSSGVSVTRRIGLSREKPQYWQALMHSFERYSGAKSRMTLPKRCCVICCERRDSGSSSSVAAGEIKCAKSSSESSAVAQARARRRRDAVSERWTKAASGSALNSVTKLTS